MAETAKANPQNLDGERNLDCPHYVSCLDVAASNMWAHFSCEFCSHRNERRLKDVDELDICAPGWEDIWGGGA